MGQRIRTDVPIDQIAATLAPVFARYAERDDATATFGDWSDAVGAETIATWLPEPVVRRRARPAATTEGAAAEPAADA
jgi:hypothetical protein